MDRLSYLGVTKYRQIFAFLSPTGLLTIVIYLSAIPKNGMKSDTIVIPTIISGNESTIRSGNESKITLLDLKVLSFGLNEYAYFVNKPVCVSPPNQVIVYGATKPRWQKLFNFFEVRLHKLLIIVTTHI